MAHSVSSLTFPLWLATGNLDKVEEFQELATRFQNVASHQESFECRFHHYTQPILVEENGHTFHENALLKAQKYAEVIHSHENFFYPVLSDDSGLIVHSLPDQLGVQTARFGGEDLSYREKRKKLLEMLSHLKAPSDRTAEFVCVLCLYITPWDIYFFEGRLKGYIGFEDKGDQGFGYDPIFIPTPEIESFENSTLDLNNLPSFAENIENKHQKSHRAKALKELIKFLWPMAKKSLIKD